LLTIKMLLKFT